MASSDVGHLRQRLHELIRERALKFGDFVLASGQRSSYYIDGKQITLDSEGAWILAQLILELIADLPVDAVGGMAIGADPITGAVLAAAAAQGKPLRGFMVRKEPKQRGTMKQVEGPLRQGDKVAIIEDVITTGGSSLKAIEAVRREAGAEVLCVVAMVDRLQGARENLASEGIELRSIFTIRDFGIEPPGLRSPVDE